MQRTTTFTKSCKILLKMHRSPFWGRQARNKDKGHPLCSNPSIPAHSWLLPFNHRLRRSTRPWGTSSQNRIAGRAMSRSTGTSLRRRSQYSAQARWWAKVHRGSSMRWHKGAQHLRMPKTITCSSWNTCNSNSTFISSRCRAITLTGPNLSGQLAATTIKLMRWSLKIRWGRAAAMSSSMRAACLLVLRTPISRATSTWSTKISIIVRTIKKRETLSDQRSYQLRSLWSCSRHLLSVCRSRRYSRDLQVIDKTLR